ncbi:MAG: hypothetical protein ACQEWU_10170 [Bacillota bacterium]|uniref:hypothetical protein n=1 Tax=Virgibacillus sp. Bac332 TaxID=2419842 RepID=UPI000EF4BE2F|nr:hypothetical protein [Virgibacillus sp. Bac332]
MRHFPKWMIIIVVAFAMIATVFTYMNQSFRYNDITKVMNEAASIAVSTNVDESIRVNEEKMILSVDEFEEDFKVQFMKVNTKLKVKKYGFDYLISEDGFYKAVKIKVTDDEDTTYEINYATDFVNSSTL